MHIAVAGHKERPDAAGSTDIIITIVYTTRTLSSVSHTLLLALYISISLLGYSAALVPPARDMDKRVGARWRGRHCAPGRSDNKIIGQERINGECGEAIPWLYKQS